MLAHCLKIKQREPVRVFQIFRFWHFCFDRLDKEASRSTPACTSRPCVNLSKPVTPRAIPIFPSGQNGKWIYIMQSSLYFFKLPRANTLFLPDFKRRYWPKARGRPYKNRNGLFSGAKPSLKLFS